MGLWPKSPNNPTNTSTQIKYHGYISSRIGERRKITSIDKAEKATIFCRPPYQYTGIRKRVAYLIRIEITRKIIPAPLLFFSKKYKPSRAKKTITTSL